MRRVTANRIATFPPFPTSGTNTCCGRRAFVTFWKIPGDELCECACGAVVLISAEPVGRCEACSGLVHHGDDYGVDPNGIILHRKCPRKRGAQ